MGALRRDPLPAIVRRTLTRRERIVLSVRRHWAWLLEPVATMVAGTVLVLGFAMDSGTDRSVVDVLWVLWLALAARTALRWYLWWRHCFVVTTERFVLVHGGWTVTVSQLPLAFGKDVTLKQSLPGQLLGFGDFILETAPKDHMLKRITWLPDSEHLYRQIARLMQDGPDDDTLILPGYDDNRVVIVDETSRSKPEQVRRHAGDVVTSGRGPGALSMWRGVRSTLPARSPAQVIPSRVRRGLGRLLPGREPEPQRVMRSEAGQHDPTRDRTAVRAAIRSGNDTEMIARTQPSVFRRL